MYRILNTIKNNIISLIFSVLGIEIVFYSLYRKVSVPYILLIIVGTIVLYAFYDSVVEALDKGPQKYIPVALSIGVLSILAIKVADFETYVTYSSWIFNGGSKLVKSLGFEIGTLVLITLIFSSMFYYFTVKIIRAPIVLLLVYMVIILFIKCIYQKENIFLYVFIAFFFIIVILGIRNSLIIEGKTNIKNKDVIFIGGILVTIMLFLAFIIPKPSKLPEIKPLDRVKEYLLTDITKGQEGGFSVESNNSRNINESTTENPEKVLYTFIGENPGYLINHNYDVYEKEKWKFGNEELFLGPNIRRYELEMPIEETKDLVKRSGLSDIKLSAEDDTFLRSINLQSEDYLTSQIIHPSNTVKCTIEDGNEDVYINDFGIIFLKDGRYFEKENRYKIYYLTNNPKEGSQEEAIMKYFNKERYLSLVEETATEDEKRQARKEIKNIYSDYSSVGQLSEEVINLSKDITCESISDYDKAKVIEDYFTKGDFTYNLKIPSKILNEDYINYFILKGKEGYCIQYATAMTLMCRASNIPARYVEGYLIEDGDKVGDERYEVKQSKAHAFVEVYIAGFGWKVFDPTPAIVNEEVSSSDDIDISYYINQSKSIFAIFGVILLAGIIIIYKATGRYRKFRKILKKSNEEALEEIINNSVRLLNDLGFNPKDGETELNFAKRVEKELKLGFKGNLQSYYSYKYAFKTVTRKDVNTALEVNKKISILLKKSQKNKQKFKNKLFGNRN